MTADEENADPAAVRALTEAELARIAASVADMPARQPATTAHVRFDDPPDVWLAVLRAL